MIGGFEELDDVICVAGGSVIFVLMDLMLEDGIEQFGQIVMECWEKLDILIVNVGVLGVLILVLQVKVKIWYEVIGVNLFVLVCMICVFEVLFFVFGVGCVVFVFFGVVCLCCVFWVFYVVFKVGMDVLVQFWVNEYQQDSLCINIVYFGVVCL